MKTIQQRLQSRISRRSTAIRHVEADVALLKRQRQTARDLDMGFLTDGTVENINDTLYDARILIKGLADDQRLDKQLKNVLGNELWRERQVVKGHSFLMV